MMRIFFTSVAFYAYAAGSALSACSVCSPKYNQKQAWAYLTMSMLFTAIPVVFGLGVWLWIRRQARRTSQLK